MRNSLVSWAIAVVAVLTCSPETFAQQSGPHDLSGIWSRNAQYWGGGEVCPGCGDRGFGNEVPQMTPDGEARFNLNRPSYGRYLGSDEAIIYAEEEHIGRRRAVPPGVGNDPAGFCNPYGLTRALLFPNPVEWVQTSDRIFQFFAWTRQWREIWLDGRELPSEPDLPRWYGYSVGRWEGDTLIVDTVGFDGRSWVDHFGYPHSDQMKLQERYRKVEPETLELTMTLTDPLTYEAPWESERKLFRLAPKDVMTYDGWYGILEEPCAPVDEVDSFNSTIRNPAGGVGGVAR